MQLRVQILAILTSLAILTIILVLVYKRRLREEYSLLWLLAAITLLVLSLFRGALTRVAGFLQVSYAPSLLFAVSAVLGLMIMLSHAVAITTLVRRNRDIAQKLAVLEWRLEQLRAGTGEEPDREGEPVMKSDRKEQVLIASRERKVPQ